MRIAYCTNVRLPSERAHGHQVARVCDALAALGHEVEIFVPQRRNSIQDDYWTFHKADRRVQLTYLGKFDPIDWPIPKFLQLFLLNFQFTISICKKLQMQKTAIIYTRSPALLSTLLKTKIPVALELHTLPKRGRSRFAALCNRCALVICLTTPMRSELLSWGVEPGRVIVEADAINLQPFTEAHSAPPKKPIIGYAGQLSSMGLSKGIPEFLDAFLLLRKKKRDAELHIAGPEARDVALMHRLQKTEGVVYRGFLPHEQIPAFLSSCSVLVYPAPASSHPFYTRDTSPLKIFEYMAAKKPIVAADLPPLRDILNEENAYFCKPGDPQSLADGIVSVLAHPEEAAKKAERAFQAVQNHTWEKRMTRILQAL